MSYKKLLLSAFCAGLSLSAAELKLHGVLGQSQPDGSEPLRASASGNSAYHESGDLLFDNGGKMYFLPKGAKTAVRAPFQLPGAGVAGDGKEVWLVQGKRLFPVGKNEKNDYVLKTPFLLNKSFQIFAVADSGTDKGFAEKGKFFGFNTKDGTVFAWDRNGNELGIVFTLKKEEIKGAPVSMGIMPGTGELLIGTYYPGCLVYRYRTDGSMIRNAVWPWKSWAQRIGVADGYAWGLNFGASRLENTLPGNKKYGISDHFDRYATGISGDGGNGYYLATTQGLKHYSKETPQVCDYRIGGTGGISVLSLNNGDVIASDGGRMLRMSLDDFPDSPFRSTGNEDWLIGGKWGGVRAVSILPEGKKYLLLDNKSKTVWQFDPEGSAWKKTRFVKRSEKVAAPSDFAKAGSLLLIADDGKLNLKNDLAEPVCRVDAFSGTEIVAANENALFFLKDGKTVWKTALPIHDIAVIDDFIAVAGKELKLFDKSGKEVFSAPYELSALAADGKWLVGAERSKSRILKFKLK